MSDIRFVQVLFGNKEFVGGTESRPDDPFIVLRDPAFVVRIPVGQGKEQIGVTPLKNVSDYVPQELMVPAQGALAIELNPDGILMKTYRQITSGLHLPNGREIFKTNMKRAN